MVKKSYFFIGVAGVGMSALAQYMAGKGFNVSGSDRRFAEKESERIREQLESSGVKCFLQNGSGINKGIDFVVISTAIESDNPDISAAKSLGLAIIHRSELLAKVTEESPTIAVSGTSGKSTVTGLVWHILNSASKDPSLLSGAGLTELEEQGKIGNAVAGNGWLVAEADESDGTLTRYSPKVGLVLNIDKDHKEITELQTLFATFAENIKKANGTLILNASNALSKQLASTNPNSILFGWDSSCAVQGKDFKAKDFSIEFTVAHKGEQSTVSLPMPGKHNAENALAAITACLTAGVSLAECAKALSSWKGIYRRHQICVRDGIAIVDDYAHNPAKIAASIRSCQGFAKGKLFAWFQPHGFGPTKFLKDDFIEEISKVLRPQDSIWFSSIYYAGGTADRSFDSNILSDGLLAKKCNAHFIANREECLKEITAKAKAGDVILLMGARDPSLADFAKWVRDSSNG